MDRDLERLPPAGIEIVALTESRRRRRRLPWRPRGGSATVATDAIVALMRAASASSRIFFEFGSAFSPLSAASLAMRNSLKKPELSCSKMLLGERVKL